MRGLLWVSLSLEHIVGNLHKRRALLCKCQVDSFEANLQLNQGRVMLKEFLMV